MNELLTKEEKLQREELNTSRLTERDFTTAVPEPFPPLNDTAPSPLTDVALAHEMRRDITLHASVQQQVEATRTEELSSLGDTLRSYKKAFVFGGDSPEYTAVQSQLDRVVSLHNIPFTADKLANAKLAVLAMDAYEKLIAACDAYGEKSAGAHFKGRFSGTGRQRQQTVSLLKDFAGRDLGYLRANARLIAEKDNPTWADILQEARIETLPLDKSFDELKTIGGNASKNYILPTEKPVFLKKGEDAAHSTNTIMSGAVTSGMSESIMKLRLQTAIDAGVDEALAQRLIHCDALDYRPACGLTPQEWAENLPTLQMLEKLYKMKQANNEQLSVLQIPVGESVQISKRNVASTRFADLLGIDSLARSRTMRVTDKNGRTIEGNGMDGAPGIVFKDLNREYGADKRGSFDPQAIRQLSDLQVFDTLVGQIDRNTGNILVDRDETGRVLRVTGIDNDFAFPHTDSLRMLGMPQCPTFGVQKQDEGRTINIPHISLKLAQKLMSLTEETLRVSLVDVLEKPAIDAAWGRVRRAQDIIGPRLKEELEHPPESKSARVFLSENEWDDGAAADFDQEKELGTQLMQQGSYARNLLRILRGDTGRTKVAHKTMAELQQEREDTEAREKASAERFADRVEWRRLGRTDALDPKWRRGMPLPPVK